MWSTCWGKLECVRDPITRNGLRKALVSKEACKCKSRSREGSLGIPCQQLACQNGRVILHDVSKGYMLEPQPTPVQSYQFGVAQGTLQERFALTTHSPRSGAPHQGARRIAF
eukprot:c20388_g1_i10.p1 GENE.c20388_g1_i10~~c20388_g1_i10.p1  ORF type:complete len:112 (+),score=1.18 c20388_g1_i10:416-751(+)